MLIGKISLGIRLTQAFLRARVHVFDVLRIGRSELIQLVHAIADRRHLALHVLFAGKGIDLSPKAFVCIRLQRLMSRQVYVAVGVRTVGIRSGLRLSCRSHRLRRGRRLLVGGCGGGLLGNGSRNNERCGQRQCQEITGLHFDSSKLFRKPFGGGSGQTLGGTLASSFRPLISSKARRRGGRKDRIPTFATL